MNKERIKSVGSFIILTLVLLSIMQWVLPRFGIKSCFTATCALFDDRSPKVKQIDVPSIDDVHIKKIGK